MFYSMVSYLPGCEVVGLVHEQLEQLPAEARHQRHAFLVVVSPASISAYGCQRPADSRTPPGAACSRPPQTWPACHAQLWSSRSAGLSRFMRRRDETHCPIAAVRPTCSCIFGHCTVCVADAGKRSTLSGAAGSRGPFQTAFPVEATGADKQSPIWGCSP